MGDIILYMGNWLLSIFDKFASKERKILMLGLDGAGKTTILTNLKFNEDLNCQPTVGFNVDTLT